MKWKNLKKKKKNQRNKNAKKKEEEEDLIPKFHSKRVGSDRSATAEKGN